MQRARVVKQRQWKLVFNAVAKCWTNTKLFGVSFDRTVKFQFSSGDIEFDVFICKWS